MSLRACEALFIYSESLERSRDSFPEGGVCLNCPQAINSSAASSVHAEYEACHLPAAERQRHQEKNVMNPKEMPR